MKKCKITILKSYINEELAAEYGAKNLTVCPYMKEGDVFYADYDKPEGFCDIAWREIYPTLFSIAHGGEGVTMKYSDWVNRPGLSINSCGDALRPVIFKIEVTDIESDYYPVSIAKDMLKKQTANSDEISCRQQ